MALTLRLQRHGSTHRPFYHLVAADSRSPRDGRFIEKLGYYDPNQEPSVIEMKEDRVQYWYGNGAVLTDTVKKLVKAKNVRLSRVAK
jgi:small subunit ribosomal protein S16